MPPPTAIKRRFHLDRPLVDHDFRFVIQYHAPVSLKFWNETWIDTLGSNYTNSVL